MDLSDKAYSTLAVLRNATWLDGTDEDIEAAAKELIKYFAWERGDYREIEALEAAL